MNNEIDAFLAQLVYEKKIKNYMQISNDWFIEDFNNPEYIPVEVIVKDDKFYVKKKQ